jgi:predicted nucleotidyltransferase
MVGLDEIQALSDAIAQRFDPERIFLFGSHARGDASDDSDVDLLIVLDFAGDALDKNVDIWSAVRPAFSVDLVLVRPCDFETRYRGHDPIVREALDCGKVLHERRCARVAG